MATTGGATDGSSDAVERSDLSTRLATWTFVAVVVAAVPIIFHAAREQWFFLDEWDFLADRDLMSLDDLLRPHNEHWSTLPIIAYRLVWQVTGLEHYWPYLALAVTAHLTAAALLLVVMRRAGVHPWIATAGASLFALFGGGRENIGWGFQVGFSGALALGLAALLLADHGGGRVGRDVLAMACAVGSLMCSGIGVTMAACLVAAVWVRRGLRAGLVSGGSLAVIFALWYAGWGHEGGGVELVRDTRALRLAGDVVQSTFANVGAVSALGWALGIAGVVGLVLLAARLDARDLRRRYAVVVGLLVGAVAFLALTGLGRAGLSVEAASRYRHVMFAMLLPALGVGLTALGQRWPAATWVAVALLVAAVPVNVGRLEVDGRDRVTLGAEELVLALATTEPPAGTPPSLRPLPVSAPEVTVGWLAQIRADGKVPEPGPAVRALQPSAAIYLAFEQERGPAGERCRRLRRFEPARLADGAVLRIPAATATLEEVRRGQPTGGSATYVAAPLAGGRARSGPAGSEVRLRALRPIVVRVRARGGRRPPEVCEG